MTAVRRTLAAALAGGALLGVLFIGTGPAAAADSTGSTTSTTSSTTTSTSGAQDDTGWR